MEIFDTIEKFASYGFNKSHAAAYAYLSYATAYFKANYPAEWMAALMTCDRDDTTKLAKFIREAKTMGLEILPPDVNQAGSEFAAVKTGIRFAMSGIKGVGQGVVEEIIAERTRLGPFSSLYEFIQRTDKTKIGKKAIEKLIEAGSFDFTLWSRDAMRESVEAMYQEASRDQKEASLGVLNLFSLIESEEKPFQAPPPVLRPSTKMDLLLREKELLGFYLTGHPMDAYKDALRQLSCVPMREFELLEEGSIVRAAFIVETLQVKVSSKSQKKFAILSISDGYDRFELPVWSDMFEANGDLLKENQLVYGILSIERREGSVSLSCKYIADLTKVDEDGIDKCDEVFDKLKFQAKNEPKWKEKKAAAAAAAVAEGGKEVISKVHLKIDADRMRLSEILILKELFRSHPGKSPIELQFYSGGKKLGEVHIAESWGVKSDAPFKEKLRLTAEKIGVIVS